MKSKLSGVTGRVLLVTGIAVLALSAQAFAASYFGEWIHVGGFNSEIRPNVLRRNWSGNTPEQAADMAAQDCGRTAVPELQRQGYRVLAYRGNATATASSYIFSSNCDVQIAR